MKEQYVILTGSKNNAGDYLIKYRAKLLFDALRPDRRIVDYDAWKVFSPEQLKVVNESKALILMGGPALQARMRPAIYKMTDNLNDIQVPIIIMGIGWKSAVGDWRSTNNYPLSPESIQLLERVDNSGYLSSVRDYHTLNTLFAKGFKNFVMSGCPALYDLDFIERPFNNPTSLQNVSFSMGTSFAHSPAMSRLNKTTILKLREYFASSNFKVTFHHSIGKEYLNSDNYNKRLWDAHQDFSEWLKKEGISYVDVSGNANNLIDHYSQEDFHIGFRVHAHIFMNSISKPSMLINEDGRGKALKDVLSGLSLDGYNLVNYNLIKKALRKIKLPFFDPYKANHFLPDDILWNIEYELKNNFPRLSIPKILIDHHYEVMKRHIEQLP